MGIHSTLNCHGSLSLGVQVFSSVSLENLSGGLERRTSGLMESWVAVCAPAAAREQLVAPASTQLCLRLGPWDGILSSPLFPGSEQRDKRKWPQAARGEVQVGRQGEFLH